MNKKFQFCFWIKSYGGKKMIIKFCYSFKFIDSTSESIDLFWSLFYIQDQPTGNFCISEINYIQICLFQMLTVHALLRENFFNHLGFEAKGDFDHRTSKIKSQSARAPKQYLGNKSLIHGQERINFSISYIEF